MKKSFVIIVSLAAVMMLSSFVIAHNVTNHKSNNPETISANDGWEYYKTVSVFREGDSYDYTLYVWKKSVCGDPDYVLSSSNSKLECECAISRNYYYGKGNDWKSGYKYVATLRGCIVNSSNNQGYFNAYLQGWD